MNNKLRLLKYFVREGIPIKGILVKIADRNYVKMINYLLDIGADPNERDININNSTPLMKACQAGNLNVVKILLERGADINLIDDFENSAIDKAYWSDHKELISFLERL